MKKYIYIIIAMNIMLIMFTAYIGATSSTNAYADGEGLVFDGINLIGSTCLATNGTQLFVNSSASSSSLIKNKILIFEKSENDFVLVSDDIEFSGEIHKMKYAHGYMFIHVGQMLYICELKRNEDGIYKNNIIYTYPTENLVSFDVDNDNFYYVIKSTINSDGTSSYKRNVIKINELTEDNIPLSDEGKLVVVDTPQDIAVMQNKLYILGKKELFITDEKDEYRIKLIMDCKKLLAIENRLAVVSGENISFINYNVIYEFSVAEPVKFNNMGVEIIDAITINNIVYLLDVSNNDKCTNIKSAKIQDNKLIVLDKVIGNNAITGTLPNFTLYTYEDCIKSGRFELAYAISSPANIIYTVNGDNSDLYLDGGTLKPTDLFMILNYAEATDFYLIFFNGKLGYILKDDSNISICHEKFSSNTTKEMQSGCYTFMIYSLPDTISKNHYAQSSIHTNAVIDPVSVNVLYELVNFNIDSGSKWLYISYTDHGTLRYGFCLKNDLIPKATDNNTYQIMIANPSFGTKLNVYEKADIASEIITAVSSGTEIRVYNLGIEMSLIAVEVNGKMYKGYVSSEHIIRRGALTTYESLGIILVVGIGAVVGVLIFIIINSKKHTIGENGANRKKYKIVKTHNEDTPSQSEAAIDSEDK